MRYRYLVSWRPLSRFSSPAMPPRTCCSSALTTDRGSAGPLLPCGMFCTCLLCAMLRTSGCLLSRLPMSASSLSSSAHNAALPQQHTKCIASQNVFRGIVSRDAAEVQLCTPSIQILG